MEKGYRFRAYPNKAQENLIKMTFGCKRFIWNHFLDMQMKRSEAGEKLLTYNQCSKKLTELKCEKEWLREPDKDALQRALKDLSKDFARYREKQKEKKYAPKKLEHLKRIGKEPTAYDRYGHPKFKAKKDRHQSYSTGSTIKFQGRKIQLPKLGKIRIKDSKKYREIKGRIYNATVSKETDGRYYISLCFTDVPVPVALPAEKAIGIDLGMKEFAITSDGLKTENPKFLKKSLNRLKFLQRALSRKTIGSASWEKNRLKVARLQKRIACQRQDFLQKFSTELIRHNAVIAIEDLQVSNMIKNHKLAMGIADVSWAEFTRQLTYKAQWHGRKLVRIDKFYPSSQLCSCCGHKNELVKDLSVRSWTCPNCNTVHDRDVNAAKNILNEGLRLLAEEAI